LLLLGPACLTATHLLVHRQFPCHNLSILTLLTANFLTNDLELLHPRLIALTERIVLLVTLSLALVRNGHNFKFFEFDLQAFHLARAPGHLVCESLPEEVAVIAAA